MLTNALDVWTQYGVGLPNAYTGGLVYNAADDVLVDATYGRGTFEIQSVSSTVFTQGALQICGDTDYADENDNFRLVRDPGNNALLDVFVNNTSSIPTYQVPLAAVTQITIYGGGGFNTLTVDSSNGLITAPNGIRFNAGDPCPGMAGVGEDGTGELILTQSGGAANAGDVYSPGPVPGEGTDVITGPSGVQSIYFTELTPVLDNVPAVQATVNGTPAANAINYSQGPGGGIFGADLTGLVTVDNQESYEFSQKQNLVIDAGAGSDEINLNDPNTPTGLTGITVAGEDPTASDTLIVNGTTGADAINFSPTAVDSADITGAGPVPITAETVERVVINGQGGNDSLMVTTPAGADTVAYTPGATVDSAAVQVGSLAPMNFLNLAPAEASLWPTPAPCAWIRSSTTVPPATTRSMWRPQPGP